MSRVSAHAGQNRDVCLSAHECLPRTLRYTPAMDLKLGTGLQYHNIYIHSSRDMDWPKLGSVRCIKLKSLTIFKAPSQSLPNDDG